jgi:hypothetical protein
MQSSTPPQKVIGISYASRHFENRKNEVTQLANSSGFFNEFKCFTEEDIPDDFKEKYKDVWNMNGPKQGGGYWIWKPLIMKMMLDRMNDDDILVYYDSGCHLNVTEDSTRRFKQYIGMTNDIVTGFLRFELDKNFTDREYTNKKTIEYLKKRYNYDNYFINILLDSPQIVGGIMIVRKTKFAINFFAECLSILEEDPKLFTDEYSEFNENHRHDQSIQSMLYKILNGNLLLKDETYFDDGYFSSEHAKKFPIWATRKK